MIIECQDITTITCSYAEPHEEGQRSYFTAKLSFKPICSVKIIKITVLELTMQE